MKNILIGIVVVVALGAVVYLVWAIPEFWRHLNNDYRRRS